LMSVGQDDQIHRWDVGNLEGLMAEGCAWLQDYLSQNPQKKSGLCVK
jgi:hypothetical protein